MPARIKVEGSLPDGGSKLEVISLSILQKWVETHQAIYTDAAQKRDVAGLKSNEIVQRFANEYHAMHQQKIALKKEVDDSQRHCDTLMVKLKAAKPKGAVQHPLKAEYLEALKGNQSVKKRFDALCLNMEKHKKIHNDNLAKVQALFHQASQSFDQIANDYWPQLQPLQRWAYGLFKEDYTKGYRACQVLSQIPDRRLYLDPAWLLSPKDYAVLQDLKHPHFRKVSGLVKIEHIEKVLRFIDQLSQLDPQVVWSFHKYVSTILPMYCNSERFKKSDLMKKCMTYRYAILFFLAANDGDQALYYAEKLYSKRSMCEDADTKIAAHTLMGDAHRIKGNRICIQYYQQAIDATDQLAMGTSWVEAERGLLRAYEAFEAPKMAHWHYQLLQNCWAVVPDGWVPESFSAFMSAFSIKYPALSGNFRYQDPRYREIEAHVCMICNLFDLGHYLLALSFSAAVLKKIVDDPMAKPTVYSLFQRMAFIRMQSGHWQEAIKTFVQAWESYAYQPFYLALQCNMGYCHAQLGSFAEAERCYENALAQEGISQIQAIEIQRLLGDLYFMQADWTKALKYFEQIRDDYRALTEPEKKVIPMFNVFTGIQICCEELEQKRDWQGFWQDAISVIPAYFGQSVWGYGSEYAMHISLGDSLPNDTEKSLYWLKQLEVCHNRFDVIALSCLQQALLYATAATEPKVFMALEVFLRKMGWHVEANRYAHALDSSEPKAPLVCVLRDELEKLNMCVAGLKTLFVHVIGRSEKYGMICAVAVEREKQDLIARFFDRLRRLQTQMMDLFAKLYGVPKEKLELHPNGLPWYLSSSKTAFTRLIKAPCVKQYKGFLTVLEKLQGFYEGNAGSAFAMQHASHPATTFALHGVLGCAGGVQQLRLRSNTFCMTIHPWSFVWLFPDFKDATGISDTVYRMLEKKRWMHRRTGKLWVFGGENHPVVQQAYDAMLRTADLYAFKEDLMKLLPSSSEKSVPDWHRVARFIMECIAVQAGISEAVFGPTSSWYMSFERPLEIMDELINVYEKDGGPTPKRLSLIRGPSLDMQILERPLSSASFLTDRKSLQGDVAIDVQEYLAQGMMELRNIFWHLCTQYIHTPNQKWPNEAFDVWFSDLFSADEAEADGPSSSLQEKLERYAFIETRVNAALQFPSLITKIRAARESQWFQQAGRIKALVQERLVRFVIKDKHLWTKAIDPVFVPLTPEQSAEAHANFDWGEERYHIMLDGQEQEVEPFVQSTDGPLPVFGFRYMESFANESTQFDVSDILAQLQDFTKYVKDFYEKISLALQEGRVQVGKRWDMIVNISGQNPLHTACARQDGATIKALAAAHSESFKQAAAANDHAGHKPREYLLSYAKEAQADYDKMLASVSS